MHNKKDVETGYNQTCDCCLNNMSVAVSGIRKSYCIQIKRYQDIDTCIYIYMYNDIAVASNE